MRHATTRRIWMWGCATAAAGCLQASAEPPLTVAAKTLLPIDGDPIRLRRTGQPNQPVVITSLAADPRGRWLAVAGDDFQIRLFDLPSMGLAATLSGHRDLIRALAFDRAGQRLASAGNDGQVLVWSASQWSAPTRRYATDPAVACLEFSPDGRQLAGVGFDPQIHLFSEDRLDGRPAAMRCGCRDLRAVAYRDDQRLLISGGRSGELHLFALQEARGADPGELGSHRMHEGRIRALAFAPDGVTLVSAAEDGSVAMFDTERREMVRRVTVTSGRLFALAVLDSRHVAVAGSDDVVRVVDLEAGRTIRHFRGHDGSVVALAASGGWLYSGGYDTTVRRWPIDALRSMQQRIAEGDQRLDR